MAAKSGTARKWVAPILLAVAAVLAITGTGSDAQEVPIELTIQGASTGGLEGAVTAGDGRTVADARVTFLHQSDDRFVGRTFTDASGRFVFDVPTTGCYSVIVDTPVRNPTDEVHSVRGGLCVGDIGIKLAAIELS